MLQPHNLKSATGARHRRKIVGRGNASGHGTYSTRGGKGQNARSGGSRGLWLKSFKQQLQSVPKLSGFKSFAIRPAEVYLRDLDSKFKDGEQVDLKVLKEKKLVTLNVKAAKILSTGEITKKLIILGVACTKGAAAKIVAAGGEIK